MVQIVMVSGKYEIWGYLLSHLEGWLLYRKMKQNFPRSLSLLTSMVLRDAFLAKVKSTESKIFLGVLPQTPFLLCVTATRDITLLATRADKWPLLGL